MEPYRDVSTDRELQTPDPDDEKLTNSSFLTGSSTLNKRGKSDPLKNRDGVWRLKVELPPGRHEYKLFADNAWVEDIPNAERVPNSFGTQNFVKGIA